jgi:hypothetical protein
VVEPHRVQPAEPLAADRSAEGGYRVAGGKTGTRKTKG